MPDRPLAAAACVLAAMALIGFIDQFVQVIARDGSLWTFHLLRSAMMAALAAAWLGATGTRLRVASWRGLAGRSVLMSAAMIVYFGALGFLPVAQAAAGLFSAPLFVAAISAGLLGRRIGAVGALAVPAGFAGVLLVLAPDPASFGAATLVPVASGAFYAAAVLATRAWCARETALALALGIVACMAVWGAGGIAVAAIVGPGEGFLGRGWVRPDAAMLGWVALQAVGSLAALVALSRAYLMAEASTVSVFEYSVLGFSAGFGWLVWGDRLGPAGLAGLALIAGAGAAIAWRERRGPAAATAAPPARRRSGA